MKRMPGTEETTTQLRNGSAAGRFQVEYRIVSEKHFGGVPLDKLVKAVNDLIAEGWKPLGAPFVACSVLAQAMTKE